MRGNQRQRVQPHILQRSIPACAGEPTSRLRCYHHKKVYPRVCGGTYLTVANPQAIAGLSPRVRGNQQSNIHRSQIYRSIPACAGEPVVCCLGFSFLWVYPRVCGGTRTFDMSTVKTWGLSPRVRGNPGDAVACLAVYRSIPACAGEPQPSRSLHCPGTVYPRVCGGTFGQSFRIASYQGLSPRVRGNLESTANGCVNLRSIPACAGEPESGAAKKSVMRVYPRVCGGTCGNDAA